MQTHSENIGSADPQAYSTHIDNIMNALAQDHALGREIDIATVACGLEPARPENRKIRDFAKKTLKISPADFDRALQREAVKTEFGRYPSDATEFVAIMAEKKRITARYNGVLRMDEIPYIVDGDGNREYIPPNLWDDYEFRTMITTKFKRIIGFDEFARKVRIKADEFDLGFSVNSLNDAAEQWYLDVCQDRLWRITATIDYTDSLTVREQGQASLRRLAETCFDCPEDGGSNFVVAVFNKFVWQVKRKIDGLPVFDHLMPVILGSQGTGKSTLVRQLLEPIDELWVMSDFKQITDDRNISLWRNFAVFLDEMGWASKSDMDTVKNIITAPTLTRRVMKTNVTQEVAQNVTFIGAANATELSDLIRDATGTRRFASLTMIDHPDRSVINGINWSHVWQSVDHKAADPMDAFRGVLQAAQEDNRTKSVVEEWVACIDPKKSMMGALTNPDRKFFANELHSAFREFETVRFPANRGLSVVDFGKQMVTLCRRADSPFERHLGRANRAYFTWCGHVGLDRDADAQSNEVDANPQVQIAKFKPI